MPNPFSDPLVEVVDNDVDTDLVKLETTPAGAALVTINRPARRNAFNAETIRGLSQVFETLHGAEGVRIVFVRGAGGTFSAGADLEWMRDAVDYTEEDNRDDAMAMATMLKHLWDMPSLTVALVEGSAYAGGAGIVAACDLAVATADARFCFSEVKLGLVPATISPYVIQAIGPRRTRGLFASAQVFDAARALAIGLVDEVVADAAALEAAQERLAKDILACAPGAVDGAKRLVAEIMDREIDHGLMTLTAHRIAAARVGEEGQAGVRAFLARQTPPWVDQA